LSEYIDMACVLGGVRASDFVDNVIKKPVSYDIQISEVVSHAGLNLNIKPSENLFEDVFGIKLLKSNGKFMVNKVHKDSPAAKANLLVADEIISVNKKTVDEYMLTKLDRDEQKFDLKIISNYAFREITIENDGDSYFQEYKIVASENASDEELNFRKSWLNLK